LKHVPVDLEVSEGEIDLKRKLTEEGLLSDRGDFASMNREYEDLIDQELKKAEVVVYDSVYKQIRMK
jgi:hypothetical protein